MDYIPFDKRLGLNKQLIITNDFPQTARVGLLYIIQDLLDKDYIQKTYSDKDQYKHINLEIARMTRTTEIVKDDEIHPVFYTMDWINVFNFVEKIYFKLLKELNDYDINGNIEGQIKSLSEVKDYFTNEISILLNEENLAFEYKDGIFNRKGYAKTSQAIKKVNTVLSDPKLSQASMHYLKALRYFNNIKTPDYENVIKESICALEACLIALYSTEISKSFENSIRKIIGNEANKVPAPIIESIIKFYGYRNNGEGISHATNKGLKVTIKEAELIISLTADYITYFYALLKIDEDDVPF